jgi:hypothetical protein
MATWWEITFTGDPTGDDLAHVAELIPQGFTSGQLVNDAPVTFTELPALPTGDYELDGLIRAYLAGALDDEGLALLTEELADRAR